jgi:hypothetical protein
VSRIQIKKARIFRSQEQSQEQTDYFERESMIYTFNAFAHSLTLSAAAFLVSISDHIIHQNFAKTPDKVDLRKTC